MTARIFGAIRDMTLEEVLRLEFAAPFDGQRLSPCTLDTILGLCRKHGMVAYLTLRHEPWREKVAKRMTELIIKHDMQRHHKRTMPFLHRPLFKTPYSLYG